MDIEELLVARFQIRVSESFIAQVDAWRRVQADIPGRSEAIRRLATIGLDAFRAEQGVGD